MTEGSMSQDAGAGVVPLAESSLSRDDRQSPPASEADELVRLKLTVERLRLEKEVDELRSVAATPWWRRGATVAGITAMISAALPITTAVHGYYQKQRELGLAEAANLHKIAMEREQQTENLRTSYLDRMKAPNEHLRTLRFLLRTASDPALLAWAEEEKAIVEAELTRLRAELADLKLTAATYRAALLNTELSEYQQSVSTKIGKRHAGGTAALAPGLQQAKRNAKSADDASLASAGGGGNAGAGGSRLTDPVKAHKRQELDRIDQEIRDKEEAMLGAGGAGGNVVGVPQCDQYVEFSRRCAFRLSPAEESNALKNEADARLQVWLDLSMSPQKDLLGPMCDEALAKTKLRFAKYGCE